MDYNDVNNQLRKLCEYIVKNSYKAVIPDCYYSSDEYSTKPQEIYYKALETDECTIRIYENNVRIATVLIVNNNEPDTLICDYGVKRSHKISGFLENL